MISPSFLPAAICTVISLTLTMTLSPGALLAGEGSTPQATSGPHVLTLEERYNPVVERLALRPEQVTPFKEALKAHRDAQRLTMATHQMGKGKFKERQRAMEANTKAFLGTLEGILTEPQMEIFVAWWEERKAEAKAARGG